MDILITLLKILLFGFLLNPDFIGFWGGCLILYLLLSMVSGERKNRALKWCGIITILVLFVASIFMTYKEKSTLELRELEKKVNDESQRLIREAEEKKPLIERSYYVDYIDFRDSLRLAFEDEKAFFNVIDSVFLEFENQLVKLGISSNVEMLTIEDYRKYHLSIDDRVDRTFIDYISKDKYYFDIFLPFLDSAYNLLGRPSVFYLHDWEALPSRDSILWNLTIDYETNEHKGIAKAEYNISNGELTIK